MDGGSSRRYCRCILAAGDDGGVSVMSKLGLPGDDVGVVQGETSSGSGVDGCGVNTGVGGLYDEVLGVAQ